MKVFTRNVQVNDSTNIQWLQYDPIGHWMNVRFNNGSIYQYENVQNKAFGRIVSSDSVGEQFNVELKAANWKTERLS